MIDNGGVSLPIFFFRGEKRKKIDDFGVQIHLEKSWISESAISIMQFFVIIETIVYRLGEYNDLPDRAFTVLNATYRFYYQ